MNKFIKENGREPTEDETEFIQMPCMTLLLQYEKILVKRKEFYNINQNKKG